GHITVVNFIDITGEPWPVKDVSWAGEFEIMESRLEDDDFENVIKITPQNEYARGNMSVSLVGLQTPIIMILETGRDEVHYRFDATVPEQGPLAEIPLIDKGITLAAGRADISGLLQGMIPASAQKLNVAGVDGRTSAYNYNGMTYLRTPLTLLSPGWRNSATSADGMRVYEIQSTPVVLLSDKGKMVRAQLSDREELLNE
ncbi:MAG: DotH/IcmK family type IV secretion protein, partial [Alphaproteobacteria bacterium]